MIRVISVHSPPEPGRDVSNGALQTLSFRGAAARCGDPWVPFIWPNTAEMVPARVTDVARSASTREHYCEEGSGNPEKQAFSPMRDP